MTKIKINSLYFSYNGTPILRDITAHFPENSVTAIVGPSGMGKSTFLMTLNRLWETISNTHMSGEVKIKFDGRFSNIYHRSYPLPQLRRSVGMVFQTPNPLPMSIYKNIAFPLKLAGVKDKKSVSEKVEKALKNAYLWEEVKDRLSDDAFALSGGQQQRLCIARALVSEPEILLLDEAHLIIGSEAGAVIEDLLIRLKERCTILVVSHYMDQVRRIADTVLELSDGKLIPRS